MNDSFFLGLVFNASLLIFLVLILDLLSEKWLQKEFLSKQILTGLSIGIIGLLIMHTNWELVPGIIFDTRSVLLSIAGLFFGFIPTAIAMLITAIYRIYIGGSGVYMGVSVIFCTGLLGILWRKFRKKPIEDIKYYELYIFGVIVHIVMLSLTPLLPASSFLSTLKSISFPVLIIYPIGTAILGYVMVSRIKRVKLNKKVLEDELKFRIVADISYDWEYWIDENGKFIFCSESCERLTGYSSKDFSQKAELLNEIVHPEDKEIMAQHNCGIIQSTSNQIDFRIIRADNTIRWIGHNCTPVYNEEKKFIGIRGSNRDITEQKLAEEKIIEAQKETKRLLDLAEGYSKALLSVVEDQKITKDEIKKLNEELEIRVEQRTRQLEMINKELESFSYSVSHDLRAPIRAVIGFSSALKEDFYQKIDDDGKEFIDRIIDSAKKMDLLIESLLKLSRISRSNITKVKVNLSDIVIDILENFRKLSPERRAEFIIQENVYTVGDINLVRIVLENLLGNAWKFTSKNEKTIIEFGSILENLTDVVYYIRDNGVGFDMKYVNKLFATFQRLHSEKDFPGTGIGLATVQRIINRHNGTIRAESKINSGTTFYFSINL